MLCIMEHQLLDNNGQSRGDDGGNAGDGKVFILARNDIADRLIADEHACQEQDHCQNDGGDTFEALVTVGVVVVGIAGRELDADDDDDTAEHIGGGMYRVADQGARMGEDTDQKL